MATGTPAPLLSAAELALVNRFQHGMPACARPFAAMGAALGCSEGQVLAQLQVLQQRGVLARVGPVFEHRRAGASSLVAMRVPPQRLLQVAAHVNGYAEVNHNYERENPFNLWFVVTAPQQARLDMVLDRIRARTGLAPLSLPMVHGFHIDLGFPLALTPTGRVAVASQDAAGPQPLPCAPVTGAPLDERAQRQLRRALEEGLPLQPRPYQALAARADVAEVDVIAQVQAWQADGLFRRLGLVVRHHALGISANLMLVMDVADDAVMATGNRLAAEPGVTLCYWRRRHLPQWRYNLYCMIHGHERAAVQQRAEQLLLAHGLAQRPHALLFSARVFKQRGGRYVARTREPEPAHG